MFLLTHFVVVRKIHDHEATFAKATVWNAVSGYSFGVINRLQNQQAERFYS